MKGSVWRVLLWTSLILLPCVHSSTIIQAAEDNALAVVQKVETNNPVLSPSNPDAESSPSLRQENVDTMEVASVDKSKKLTWKQRVLNIVKWLLSPLHPQNWWPIIEPVVSAVLKCIISGFQVLGELMKPLLETIRSMNLGSKANKKEDKNDWDYELDNEFWEKLMKQKDESASSGASSGVSSGASSGGSFSASSGGSVSGSVGSAVSSVGSESASSSVSWFDSDFSTP